MSFVCAVSVQPNYNVIVNTVPPKQKTPITDQTYGTEEVFIYLLHVITLLRFTAYRFVSLRCCELLTCAQLSAHFVLIFLSFLPPVSLFLNIHHLVYLSRLFLFLFHYNLFSSFVLGFSLTPLDATPTRGAIPVC